MIQVVKNRFLDAGLKLMLVSGIVHIFVLVFQVIVHQNVTWLNYFKMIELDLFFQTLGDKTFYSFAFVALIYLVIYKWYTYGPKCQAKP